MAYITKFERTYPGWGPYVGAYEAGGAEWDLNIDQPIPTATVLSNIRRAWEAKCVENDTELMYLKIEVDTKSTTHQFFKSSVKTYPHGISGSGIGWFWTLVVIVLAVIFVVGVAVGSIVLLDHWVHESMKYAAETLKIAIPWIAVAAVGCFIAYLAFKPKGSQAKKK